MFAQQWSTRKRGREDEENGVAGFSEHRSKRRIASLPHRTSPNLTRHVSPPIVFCTNYTTDPTPPTITPSDSDSEDKTAIEEPRSVFSPYSSSPAYPHTQSFPSTPRSPQKSQLSDAAMYSDDFEMTDTAHLSPGPLHKDSPTGVTARIPTPIHSSFSPFIRSEKASIHHDVDFADDEGIVERFRRGRRLPSPISETEISPAVIVDGMGDMQMEVDTSSQLEKETPTKKGHTRSKHSLRQWTGFGGEMGGNSGMKKSFSMGYRADCEKCRLKVPGHFSHIITY
ncbi:Uncharacterized protein BP5553_02045 [Venustampulla echinocandica]|uniref:Uncharacterized protein n=1 Tax=Venustampulla echinocandica TaxID=2656787 RepID=A0A370U2Q5_9HELO|nr:Uncharacterized protein BP5553_02045 [Venustampulla echinocandica]RDL42066.1 Uncharacterized protein BP5553_02045 [Venustampulla echinocandica]